VKRNRTLISPDSAAVGVDRAISIVEGRWKLVILFHLFGGKALGSRSRASYFRCLAEDADATTEAAGARRDAETDHPCAGSTKGGYELTPWGQALCPSFDALLAWSEGKPGGPT
jgi:DNA-binding HxlR family transcriptional regulator